MILSQFTVADKRAFLNVLEIDIFLDYNKDRAYDVFTHPPPTHPNLFYHF